MSDCCFEIYVRIYAILNGKKRYKNNGTDLLTMSTANLQSRIHEGIRAKEEECRQDPARIQTGREGDSETVSTEWLSGWVRQAVCWWKKRMDARLP